MLLMRLVRICEDEDTLLVSYGFCDSSFFWNCKISVFFAHTLSLIFFFCIRLTIILVFSVMSQVFLT